MIGGEGVFIHLPERFGKFGLAAACLFGEIQRIEKTNQVVPLEQVARQKSITGERLDGGTRDSKE